MKKATRILTASILACSMLLTGCKGKENKKESVYETKIDKEAVYRMVDFSFSEELKGNVRDMQLGGGKLYISTCEWEERLISDATATDASENDTEGEVKDNSSDEGPAAVETVVSGNTSVSYTSDGYDEDDYEYIDTYYLYSADVDGSNVKQLSKEVSSSEDQVSTFLSNMCVSEDGTFYGYYHSYDRGTETEKSFIKVLDANGTEIDEFDVDELFNSGEEYISKFLIGKDGNLYIIGDQNIYILDKSGNKIATSKFGNWITTGSLSADGEVLICYQDKDGKTLITAIDDKGKETGKKVEIKCNSYGDSTIIPSANPEYSFYYNDSSYLTGVDKEGNKTNLVNWMSSNMVSQNISYICDTGENGFLVLYYEADPSTEYQEKVYSLEKINPEDVVEKTTITYGGVWVDEDVRAAAIQFNKSQDKYQITVKDYSEYDDPTQQFNADLLAGDIPDIIDLGSVNYEMFAAKGMLEDLYPYMEKDPDMDKSDYMENILGLLETDGKLYRIANSGNLQAFAMRTSDLNGKKGISLEEFMALDEAGDDKVKGFYMTPNIGVLTELCFYNSDYYIDWSKGACNFNSDQFIKLLEYANTYPKSEDINYEERESAPSLIQRKELLGMECYSLNTEEMVVYDKMFDGDVSYVGFPSDGSEGLAMAFNRSYGISAKSQNKDGAWEFIRILMSREYFSKHGMMYNEVPTRKDCFEDMMKRSTATEEYTDDFGNKVFPISGGYGYDDFEVTTEPLTEAQAETFRDIVSRVDREYTYEEEIMEIINEEAAPFFDGQKSAKDVADIIQNRVSTYINENR